MRRNYLYRQRRILYTNLLTKGKLTEHLAETEQRALEMEERLLKQMAAQEGVTEKLKAADPLKWTRLMNNLRHSVQEIVQAGSDLRLNPDEQAQSNEPVSSITNDDRFVRGDTNFNIFDEEGERTKHSFFGVDEVVNEILATTPHLKSRS